MQNATTGNGEISIVSGFPQMTTAKSDPPMQRYLVYYGAVFMPVEKAKQNILQVHVSASDFEVKNKNKIKINMNCENRKATTINFQNFCFNEQTIQKFTLEKLKI
jgi:hypothetical protein